MAVPGERVREAEVSAAVDGIGLGDESLAVGGEVNRARRKEGDDAAN